MNLIDRQLIRAYFKAYLVCLVSLLGLYIVVDLFTNLEDFTGKHHGLLPVVQHIGTFYGYQVTRIFDRLCEAIVLLAAMFTVAWMQRSNEMLPLLSAGVSTRRVVRPVLLAACFMLGLTVVNQEVIIPRVADRIVVDKDDPYGEKDVLVIPAKEPNGIHVHGRTASRKEMAVKDFCVTIPEGIFRTMHHLSAKEARYIPPGDGPRTGGWLLTGTDPPVIDNLDRPDVLESIDPGKYFLHTKEATFEAVTRPRNWFQLASTMQLWQELQRPDSARLAPVAVMFHTRLTRPILGMVLVLLGLSVILRDQNRNVFISAGICVVLCGVFFAACFGCKQLGDNDILSPALSAWLPVLFFGPLAVVMFDAVHT
ncbi:MAG TPA: LptF/LptG family permease [Gemmataceae bacterium]|nr:LptF/LptG family permease [Gemmataceae bacterium]